MNLSRKWMLVLLVAGLVASAQAWKKPCASCLPPFNPDAPAFLKGTPPVSTGPDGRNSGAGS